jgi:gliding motility-associated-like protein
MKKVFFIFLMTLLSNIAKAQLIVDNTTLTPQQLAQSVLLGQGINISNIKFNGSTVNANTISDQIGKFDNGSTTNIGINKGIILSTGNAIIAKGPNDRDLATLPTSNSFQGDADLHILSNNQIIKNVSILEFDFIPVGNKLSFNFVFASDEYPEFVNDTYNDTFGFFLSGPGITGPFSNNAENIALIPTTTLPVSINNLNNGTANAGLCEYCSYYVNNEGGATIQYDGFTTLLSAKANVQCGQTYHIKLAISNVGDDNYDSAVFIEGASFSSSGINLGEDLKLCSETNHILDTALPTSLTHEWTKDGILLSAETSPVLNVTQSGTYIVTAYPYGASCPVSDEVKIEFNTKKTPLINCGIIKANSIEFTWAMMPNITDYSVSYQINTDSPINIGPIGNLTNYTVSGLSSGENVTITVTPIGTPIDCFGSASKSCSSTSCIIPTLALTQGSTSQNGCVNNSISNVAFTIGGGATSVSIISGSLPSGVTGNLIGNVFTISGVPTSAGISNFTISTLGGCLPNVTLTSSLDISEGTVPTFDAIAPICFGETLASLPLVSNNSISGTWTPALDNQTTTEYTFTPNSGQCANITKITINVNPKITPTFTPIAPVCFRETLNALPLLSNNNISGTWIPALDNQTTTEYTFTPNSNQCANISKLTINVNPKTTPTFTPIAPICFEETLNALPLLSNNNISGTWIPALNNQTTTEYTFTPNSGQCTNISKLYIIVNSKPIPSLSNGIICVDKRTNSIIQSYTLDSKLEETDYNFEWYLNGNKINNAIESTLETVQQGIYSVIASNKTTNCISLPTEATVTETFSDATTFEIKKTNSFNNDGSVTIVILQGTASYEYQLDNGAFQSSNVFSKISAGTHIINIIDTNGCTNLSKEFVLLGYPKFFTPNGDGYNDSWNIIGLDPQSNPVINIFDRYGKLLKQIDSTVLGWDGTYNGHPLPSTDYWFKLNYTEEGIAKEFKSHFSLKR